MARQPRVSESGGGMSDNLSQPGELIDESLSPDEQAQMDAMREGKDPLDATPPPSATEEEAPKLEADETPEEVEAREASERAPAEKGLLREVQKERERRKALEAQLESQNEIRARSDERLRIINDMIAKQGQPQQQVQEPVEPDKELDPLAWYEWKLAQNDKVMQQMQATQQQYGQQTQAMQYANQIQMQENQYAASNPQYMPAVNKLATHLDKMFEPMFPNPQERQYAIGQWTQIAVARAAQLGKNPAQLTYEIAQNAGLTQEEALEAAQTVQAATEGAPAPAQRQAGPSIKQVNSARRASQSLSNVSGAASKTSPTMDDIDKMSDEEFEAFKDRLKGKSVTQYFFNR